MPPHSLLRLGHQRVRLQWDFRLCHFLIAVLKIAVALPAVAAVVVAAVAVGAAAAAVAVVVVAVVVYLEPGFHRWLGNVLLVHADVSSHAYDVTHEDMANISYNPRIE